MRERPRRQNAVRGFWLLQFFNFCSHVQRQMASQSMRESLFVAMAIACILLSDFLVGNRTRALAFEIKRCT